MSELEKIVTGSVVLCPGDRVIIGVTAHLPRDAAEAMLATLHERHPGVRFSIMDGVSWITVLPASPPEVAVQ